MDENPYQSPATRDKTRGKRRTAVRAAWIAALLPVAYVLSIGPAFHVLPEEAWFRIYSPLGWLGEQCEPFGNVLNWWCLDVWGTHFG